MGTPLGQISLDSFPCSINSLDLPLSDLPDLSVGQWLLCYRLDSPQRLWNADLESLPWWGCLVTEKPIGHLPQLSFVHEFPAVWVCGVVQRLATASSPTLSYHCSETVPETVIHYKQPFNVTVWCSSKKPWAYHMRGVFCFPVSAEARRYPHQTNYRGGTWPCDPIWDQ